MNYLWPTANLPGVLKNSPTPDDLHISAQFLLRQLRFQPRHEPGSKGTTGPLVIIANHTSTLDLFIVYAHVKRADLFFIGAYINHLLGETWNKKLLPVFLSNKPKRGLWDYVRNVLWQWYEGHLSREEAVQRNRDAIARASSLINHGSAVLIFPSGERVGTKRTWADGVGYMIKGITHPQATIIFCSINSGSILNNLKPYFPTWLWKCLPQTSYDVKVSPPFKITRQLRSLPPKEITQSLENIYLKTFDLR